MNDNETDVLNSLREDLLDSPKLFTRMRIKRVHVMPYLLPEKSNHGLRHGWEGDELEYPCEATRRMIRVFAQCRARDLSLPMQCVKFEYPEKRRSR